jgi:hypothetical protein
VLERYCTEDAKEQGRVGERRPDRTCKRAILRRLIPSTCNLSAADFLQKGPIMISLMSPCNTVAIGSTVGIRDLHSNEREVYTLTHPRDADITCNKISSLTPLAFALHGRRIGDIVEVDAPGGTFRVRVESIEDEEVDLYARAG